MKKMKVGLVQINNSFDKQCYLPYTVGMLQAYALKHLANPEDFEFLLPIFDRIPLHILSRALFGEVVTTKSLLKDWARILLPHLIKSLTIYRLDFARAQIRF